MPHHSRGSRFQSRMRLDRLLSRALGTPTIGIYWVNHSSRASRRARSAALVRLAVLTLQRAFHSVLAAVPRGRPLGGSNLIPLRLPGRGREPQVSPWDTLENQITFSIVGYQPYAVITPYGMRRCTSVHRVTPRPLLPQTKVTPRGNSPTHAKRSCELGAQPLPRPTKATYTPEQRAKAVCPT